MIRYKGSADIITLVATDYRYAGHAYCLHGINGICLNDVSPGQQFQFQTTGVFSARKEDFDPEHFSFADDDVGIFYFNKDEELSSLFGLIVSDVNPISQCFDFVLVQWYEWTVWKEVDDGED